MVPLFLAGVDLNTFGFRRVFSFISPCHWRYCPLPQRRGLASAQNHEFTTHSETRFIFQLHFVTTIPTLTHINGKRFLLRPVFLFIVFIGLFGLVLLRIYPYILVEAEVKVEKLTTVMVSEKIIVHFSGSRSKRREVEVDYCNGK